MCPEAATQGTAPCVQNILPEAPRARAENEADVRGTFPDGCTDTRTQILNLFILLVVINFVLNIYILHYLIHIQFF